MNPTTNQSSIFNARFWALTATILIAAALRLVPHPANFSPITAMALFGGAYFANRSKLAAFILPLAALFISDAVLGFHNQMPAVYIAFMIVTMIGLVTDRKSPFQVGGAALLGSTLFFVITNFSVWISGELYPRTSEGLVACYIAAVPFFQNALAGDLLYTGAMFAAWALIEKTVPSMQTSELA